ncbi:MAG: hypothetical protein BGN92_05345 [Sphingobacteriales bacterium 41-5]|nr:MAG: hypothetical protein BGN92_05345 [Sphingobacteriales bacterium 41-5]
MYKNYGRKLGKNLIDDGKNYAHRCNACASPLPAARRQVSNSCTLEYESARNYHCLIDHG